MPIRKFRDVDEMEDTLWYERDDPALARAIRSVWEFAERTCPQRFPPGVYRHRSIEADDELREQWEEANWLAFRQRRAARKDQ